MPSSIPYLKRKGITASPPIGFCIYCNSTTPPLTKEHVIPEFLAGTLTLRDATCEDCREMTRVNEQSVAREVYQGVRAHLGMKFKQKPSHVLMRTGLELDAVFRIKAEDHPNFFCVTVPEPPGILSQRPREAPVAMQPFFWGFNDKAAENRREGLGVPPRIYREFDPLGFARFLAKVGLGISIHSFGARGVETDDIRAIIQGTQEPFYLVGGIGDQDFDPPPTHSRLSHFSASFSCEIGGESYAAVQLQLFHQLSMPVYSIIVGKLTDAGREKVCVNDELRYA